MEKDGWERKSIPGSGRIFQKVGVADVKERDGPHDSEGPAGYVYLRSA